MLWPIATSSDRSRTSVQNWLPSQPSACIFWQALQPGVWFTEATLSISLHRRFWVRRCPPPNSMSAYQRCWHGWLKNGSFAAVGRTSITRLVGLTQEWMMRQTKHGMTLCLLGPRLRRTPPVLNGRPALPHPRPRSVQPCTIRPPLASLQPSIWAAEVLSLKSTPMTGRTCDTKPRPWVSVSRSCTSTRFPPRFSGQVCAVLCGEPSATTAP